MKKYENMDNFRKRDLIVEVTLQQGEYKGTIKQKIRGNCFGLSVLKCFEPDDLSEDEEFYENNCGLRIVEDDNGEYWYECTLTDEEGNECEMNG